MDDWDEAEFAAQLEIEAAMEMEAERWAAAEAAPAEAPPAADAPDAPTEVPNGIPHVGLGRAAGAAVRGG